MKNLKQFIVIILTSTAYLCKFTVAIDAPKSATSTSSKNPTTTTSTSFAPNVSTKEGTGTETKHANHFASFAHNVGHNVGDAVHHFTEDVEGMKEEIIMNQIMEKKENFGMFGI